MRFLRAYAATFALALLSAFLALPIQGCAAVASLLPDVIAYVQDGAAILDAIERFCLGYFAAHPDPVAQKGVDHALAKARAALNLALRTAQGAKHLDDQQVDAAFEDFKQAYIELLGIVRSYGVKESALPSGMALRAVRGDAELIVPTPIAFKSAMKAAR